jgi:hypothetical protein
MANIDYLRKKVKYHIRDIHILDPDLNDMINTVLEEIAYKTRIFKKVFGFTVHKEIQAYNFKNIARLNEQVELEPIQIAIGNPTPEDMLKFVLTGVFPDPQVTKELVTENSRARMFDLVDIFDKDGISVLDKFEERGSSYYFCYDENWRTLNDKQGFMFVGTVIPEVDELEDDKLVEITSAVIAGMKFYVNDTMHSPNDTQATNYDYMRWYQTLEELRNRYPTTTFANSMVEKDRKWI